MKNILVAIDFSDVTASLMETACTLAKALGSKLCLVHVQQLAGAMTGLSVGLETGIVPSSTETEDPRSMEDRLAELKDKAAKEGVEVATKLLRGAVVEKLVEEVGKTEADLTVVGSHGHGAVYHLVVGSVAEGLLKKSPCPVLVVRTRRP